jgi:hypothetical protein
MSVPESQCLNNERLLDTMISSGVACRASHRIDFPHHVDQLLCPAAMSEISVPIAGRRAAASAMHPTYGTASDRRRATGLARPLRFCPAPGCGIECAHGVDVHFVCTPTPTGSCWRARSSSSSMVIGPSALAVTTAIAGGDAGADLPVVTVSATTAWSAFTVTCFTTICCWPRFRCWSSRSANTAFHSTWLVTVMLVEFCRMPVLASAPGVPCSMLPFNAIEARSNARSRKKLAFGRLRPQILP